MLLRELTFNQSGIMTITVNENPNNGLIEVTITNGDTSTMYEVVITECGRTEVDHTAIEDDVDTLIELAVELYLN
jgi:hypothetical protein